MMTFHVLVDKSGRIDRINDQIQLYSLFGSRAHALRVIRWLGLARYRIRPATEEEVAAGMFCTAHCTPQWRSGAGQNVTDRVAAMGVAVHGR